MTWIRPTIHSLVDVQVALGAVAYKRKRWQRLQNPAPIEVIVVRYHPDTDYVDFVSAADLKTQMESDPDHPLHVDIYSTTFGSFKQKYEPITGRHKRPGDEQTRELPKDKIIETTPESREAAVQALSGTPIKTGWND